MRCRPALPWAPHEDPVSPRQRRRGAARTGARAAERFVRRRRDDVGVVERVVALLPPAQRFFSGVRALSLRTAAAVRPERSGRSRVERSVGLG